MASYDYEDVKRRIISTALERRNAAGGPTERYVAHLSILEDGEDGQPKPRYTILSVTDAGAGFIHKSKWNTNGTFSIGKTWNLSELRGIEVNVINISLTLSRTYRWRCDHPAELTQFAQALIGTHKSIGGQTLRLIGLRDESGSMRHGPNGFTGPGDPSQSSLGPSRSYERERGQEPPVRLPPGPLPRANLSGQPRQAQPSQDTSSFASRYQSQSIPSSGGNTRFSDAYGGTMTSTRASSDPRPTTPSRDQFNRNGPVPGIPSSRSRNFSAGPSHPENPEFPPPPRPQGLGYPDKPQTPGIPSHPNRRPPPLTQNGPSASGLPPTNGASGLLSTIFNRTGTGRDDGTIVKPAPLTTQTPTRSGFDDTPTTPTRAGIPRSFSPGLPGGSTASRPDTGVSGATRLNDTDTLPPKPLGPIPSPLAQRPQLPESTRPSQTPQASQFQQQQQSFTPTPRTVNISPNGPPPSAFNNEELIPEPSGLISPLPSGLPSALRSAPFSALVTSLPLRPADNPHSRNARISFFDPPNQALLDRLLATDSAIVASSGAGAGGGDNEEESIRATLTSVEEMLDGFEWATEDIFGKNSRGGLGLGVGSAGTGSAEQMEARLLDELMALERANIYSFIESDDRIDIVVKYLDEAINELDLMERHVTSYSIHLNEVADDISYIQSQNRGLQVQTQNQRALMAEIENLLETVDVDRESLATLTQGSLEKSKSIQKLEEAAADLYKALQAGRDRDMAAGMERLSEYRTYNSQFCKRIFDYLSIMFTVQSKMLLGDNNGVTKGGSRRRASMGGHKTLEKYLGRYSGLILYLKEMDEPVYARLCGAYFSAASELHNTQMQALFTAYATAVKKSVEDDSGGFSVPLTALAPRTGLRRVGTARNKSAIDKGGASEESLSAAEALGYVLDEIAPAIRRERTFIADFLQINDAALTFADYMGLENYFRRQAMRSKGISQATLKLVRGAMDLIFGYLPTSVKTWVDTAAAGGNLQVVGVLAALELFMSRADERDNEFLLKLLEKHHARLKAQFDRYVNEQIKTVEDTKLNSRKRGGVAHFVKYFPVYVGRIEGAMFGTEGLEIRQNVDAGYDRIVKAMFESLKRMAKMDGEGEDKGQLNYHVILIENMHHFVAEIQSLDIGSVASFLVQAEGIYDENLAAYVRLVLRRPFLKILDYFEGIDRLLKTTAPTEVQNNSSYSKSALKKIVKEYTAKDVRKHVDALFKRVEKHFEDDGAVTSNVGGIQPGSALPTSRLGPNSTFGPDAQASNTVGGGPGGTLVAGVWKACEDELLRTTEMFQKRIGQCYANTGVSLEYGPADVRDAFKRHRV